MSHVRQQIREDVAASLAGISGVTVYSSRVYPVVTPPAISVAISNETSDLENESMPSPRRYSRRARLQITITVAATSGHDNAADSYAAQVEALLGADLTLGGTCTDSKLVGSDANYSGEGEKKVAELTLTYEIWYRTTETDAETPL